MWQDSRVAEGHRFLQRGDPRTGRPASRSALVQSCKKYKQLENSTAGVFNLLSSRANLHLSFTPAGRSHCRLQNHHGYIKLHRRGCSPGNVASFYNPYIASPTSQLIPQPFRRFTYVTAHSTALSVFHLRHRHFTYVTAHSLTRPPLYLRHSSFYSPSVVSPTS